MGECCQAVAQGGEAFDRACHAARENGSALVRGRPMPVGYGRFRDRTQVPRGVLGMTFSSSLALNQEGCVAKSVTTLVRSGSLKRGKKRMTTQSRLQS